MRGSSSHYSLLLYMLLFQKELFIYYVHLYVLVNWFSQDTDIPFLTEIPSLLSLLESRVHPVCVYELVL